jgi:hypothetical protein
MYFFLQNSFNYRLDLRALESKSPLTRLVCFVTRWENERGELVNQWHERGCAGLLTVKTFTFTASKSCGQWRSTVSPQFGHDSHRSTCVTHTLRGGGEWWVLIRHDITDILSKQVMINRITELCHGPPQHDVSDTPIGDNNSISRIPPCHRNGPALGAIPIRSTPPTLIFAGMASTG